MVGIRLGIMQGTIAAESDLCSPLLRNMHIFSTFTQHTHAFGHSCMELSFYSVTFILYSFEQFNQEVLVTRSDFELRSGVEVSVDIDTTSANCTIQSSRKFRDIQGKCARDIPIQEYT